MLGQQLRFLLDEQGAQRFLNRCAISYNIARLSRGRKETLCEFSKCAAARPLDGTTGIIFGLADAELHREVGRASAG